MNGFRDVELLSAYLDGQLDPSDSARLELRIKSDPELASVFNDLRIARGILKKLPARKVPRNFTLTRKMAGVGPPLPRSYSFFRTSSVLATLLLLLTFGFNSLGSRISFGAAAPAPENGIGGGLGMGGGCEEPCVEQPLMEAAVTTEAPAAQEAPSEGTIVTTQMPPAVSADSAVVIGTPTPEAALPKAAESFSQPKDQAEEVYRPTRSLNALQFGLIIVGVLLLTNSFALLNEVLGRWFPG